jgi:hypothetical protein
MGEANSAETAPKDSCTAGNTRILIQPVKEPVLNVLACRGVKVPHQSDLVSLFNIGERKLGSVAQHMAGFRRANIVRTRKRESKADYIIGNK